jgi:2-oxoglutarate ferredoxin oxidoreductase subunit beta
MSINLKILKTDDDPNWCPGCGDFGILQGVKNAMVELERPLESYAVISGIGCGSKLPHWVRTQGFDTLHGRAAPVASGLKLANHDLNVIIVGGDGDGYGIGMGHLMHLMRRNYNMLYILQNNEVYGLTTGQTSPTTPEGTKTHSTPHGALEIPVNPIHTMLAGGATWIGRAFAGDLPHITQMIKEGIEHPGIAILDVLQPCVAFNKAHNYAWYQARIQNLQEMGHDPSDKAAAFAAGETLDEKINIGLFYKEERPVYEASLKQLEKEALVHQDISEVDVQPLLDRLR